MKEVEADRLNVIPGALAGAIWHWLENAIGIPLTPPPYTRYITRNRREAPTLFVGGGIAIRR